MTSPLAIDMSRLWLASLRPTPRGIERVDLALVRELCRAWTGELFGLTWTPWGLRMVDRAALTELAEHVAGVWREQADAEHDPAFLHLRDWLSGRAEFTPEARVSRLRHNARRFARGARAIRATGVSPGRPATSLPKDCVVASFGHVGLALPAMQALLDARPDIRIAALIHDMVSLTDPQFFPPRNEPYFRGVLDRALARDNLVLTTTDHVRKEIEALAGGLPVQPQVRVVGISEAFRDVPEPSGDEELSAIPYFLMCGTREPRKNHVLILNLWRRLADNGGVPPKLVLVGGHGWGTELVAGMLARSDALRGHVAHVETLGSPGLFRLMGQARALLSPSFAEGYGLPVEEALGMGVAVLAAQSPVFAETTRGAAELFDPLDGPAWRAAIARHAESAPPTSAERVSRATRFRAAGPGHVTIVDRLTAFRR
jgi:glycosyltransferase involved in cell wall biosynthesis